MPNIWWACMVPFRHASKTQARASGLAGRSPPSSMGVAPTGMEAKDIAAALGVTQGAVSQWLKRGKMGGMDALRRRTAPGSSPRLSMDQRVQLVAALAKDAPAFGFVGEVWTTKRI